MGYEQALEKAWGDILGLTEDKRFSAKLLADEYDINLEDKKVFSVSCNVPAKDYTSIILLHYIIKKLKLKTLPDPTGNWIDFRQLEGGGGYYPTFKKRTIDVVSRKYGSRPEALLDTTNRFCAKKVQIGDVGIVIEPLENMPVLITISKGDEEFPPDANMLFDESIREIFCTEDIVVLTEIIVHSL